MATIKTYSQAEKKAYYSGMGYRAAKNTVAKYPKLAKKKSNGGKRK